MKLRKLADFWNARERRERFLLLTVLSIFILVLLGAYFNNAYSSIAYQSKALERSKDDFYYVSEKANAALIYQNTQQIIAEASSVEDFINSQAKLSEIFNNCTKFCKNFFIMKKSSSLSLSRILKIALNF